MFKPAYETYQDVKATLAWWSAAIWLLVECGIWYGLLTGPQRAAILAVFPDVARWVQDIGTLVALAVLARAVSHILVHVVEVHDHVYDRYVIKWRKNYARDFIIPMLLAPYQGRLDPRIGEVIDRHPGDFLNTTFYYFVGDRDTKIRKNLLVRIYEVLTKYWLTQIGEIAFIFLVVVCIAWLALTVNNSLPIPRSFYVTLFVGVVGFLVSRAFAIVLRKVSIAPATQAEIEDIWRCCANEHEQQMRRFCHKHGLYFDGVNTATVAEVNERDTATGPKMSGALDPASQRSGERESVRHVNAGARASRPLSVFLCHASEDKGRVRELYHTLKELGVDPWLDEESILPGQEWTFEIRKAVRRSDVVLVCLSSAAIDKRGFVQKEIALALDIAEEQPEGSIFLIPLRLEECEVPERLQRWQWLDLFKPNALGRLAGALDERARSLGLTSLSFE